ncbi:hypothetical protein MKJ04_13055 [Pontibacter sp. E15-1]|uniref:hypothetical protein n=1 Tax=Pontibacter sp. E15-1 TaxID=2919918 RepID=UPI001F4F186C|nr:hypothetical protein [Pontibacter sp. E15-1]MCJ8165775.1 hypothetical protein [Pontibacter sp. E15-1]
MKKITFVAAIAFAGFFATEASAQTAAETPQQTQAAQQGNKQKVTQEQLPEAVKTTLASDVYADWKVGDIYKVAPEAGVADAKETYEVTMTNAQGQTGSVVLDAEGKDAAEKE